MTFLSLCVIVELVDWSSLVITFSLGRIVPGRQQECLTIRRPIQKILRKKPGILFGNLASYNNRYVGKPDSDLFCPIVGVRSEMAIGSNSDLEY